MGCAISCTNCVLIKVRHGRWVLEGISGQCHPFACSAGQQMLPPCWVVLLVGRVEVTVCIDHLGYAGYMMMCMWCDCNMQQYFLNEFCCVVPQQTAVYRRRYEVIGKWAIKQDGG